MSALLLSFLLLLPAEPAPPGFPLSFAETDVAFEAYMHDLALLSARWQRAAELIDVGGAKALLNIRLPESLDRVWADRQELLQKKAKLHRFYLDVWIRKHACSDLARWYVDAEHPSLALVCLKNCSSPQSSWRRTERARLTAQAAFASGRFGEAADHFAAMDTTGWSKGALDEHVEWIATLRGYASEYPQASGPPCEYYSGKSSPAHRRGMLGTILGVLECLEQDATRLTRKRLLEEFAFANDKTARRLFLQKLATDPNIGSKDAAAAMLMLGVDAHQDENFPTAMNWWRLITIRFPQTPDWPKALFNVATTLRDQQRYPEAIEALTRLRDAEVNDREPGGHLMEAYRNYRPRASWQIGICRLKSGDPAGALANFINTRENFPFQSWCGNAHWEYARKYAAYEGICLEMTGSYDQAIAAYFRPLTIAPGGGIFMVRRIVDLYESVGQTERLLKLCNELDEYRLEEIRRELPDLPSELPEAMRPTNGIRRLLHIRTMDSIGDATALIEMVDVEHGQGPDSPGDLRSNWQVVEAAKTLAQRPIASFNLLRERALSKNTRQNGWLYYAMTVVNSTKAIPFIANELSDAKNQHHCATLAFSLQQCGAGGIEALESIEQLGVQTYHKTLRARLALLRRSEREPWPDLPAASPGTSLPSRLAQINEKVRLLESLPTVVAVDRSTPRMTIESWIMALRIADREAHIAVTGDDTKLIKIFADLSDSSGRRDARFLTYELERIRSNENNAASALVALRLEKTVHHVAIELSRVEGGWRVDSVKPVRK